MTSTGARFDRYSQREPQVFRRFLDNFDQMPEFERIKEALGRFEHHPDDIEDYDIRSETEGGYITFDTQESNNFKKYWDLRLDYVSSFVPVGYRTANLQRFKNDVAAGAVTVEKWGKVVEPKADFLVVEFQNGYLDWQIYHLPTLHRLLPQLETAGDFHTNHKRGEPWGSAFLAVKERNPLLQSAKPKNLDEILSRAKPQV